MSLSPSPHVTLLLPSLHSSLRLSLRQPTQNVPEAGSPTPASGQPRVLLVSGTILSHLPLQHWSGHVNGEGGVPSGRRSSTPALPNQTDTVLSYRESTHKPANPVTQEYRRRARLWVAGLLLQSVRQSPLHQTCTVDTNDLLERHSATVCIWPLV